MLHLIKLAVACRSVEDLTRRMSDRRSAEGLAEIRTRQTPRRLDELAGGSIYWVIAGVLSARQPIVRVEAIRDDQGARTTSILLDATPVAVLPRAVRAFQGWRYLVPADAPADLVTGGRVDGADEMPHAMRRQLAELCLL